MPSNKHWTTLIETFVFTHNELFKLFKRSRDLLMPNDDSLIEQAGVVILLNFL